MTADLDAVRAMLEGVTPFAWLTDSMARWLENYDGTACGRMTAVHNRPLKNGTGLAVYRAADFAALAADLATTRAALAEAQGEVERLREALTALEKQASITVNRGAVTGPHWTQLTIACLNARQALKGPAK